MEGVTHTGEGLIQPKFDKVKWGFPTTSGIKEYHIKRKQRVLVHLHSHFKVLDPDRVQTRWNQYDTEDNVKWVV